MHYPPALASDCCPAHEHSYFLSKIRVLLSRLFVHSHESVMKNLLSITMGMLLSFSLGAQAVYYVKSGAQGAGSSWQNASGDLAAVLLKAQSGDEVWVAKGTYKPTQGVDRSISFQLKSGVKMYGGFQGYEASVRDRNLRERSVLSGEIGEPGMHDNTYNVVYTKNPDSSTVLDGFRITLGSATADYSGGALPGSGGGLYCDAANGFAFIRVVNCEFYENYARDGSAVYLNAKNGESAPVFVDCQFFRNNADLDGGAVCIDSRARGKAHPIFTDCHFNENSAYYGGVVAVHHAEGSSTVLDLRRCIVNGNTAFSVGGGIYYSERDGEVMIVSLESEFSNNYPADVNRFYNITREGELKKD